MPAGFLANRNTPRVAFRIEFATFREGIRRRPGSDPDHRGAHPRSLIAELWQGSRPDRTATKATADVVTAAWWRPRAPRVRHVMIQLARRLLSTHQTARWCAGTAAGSGRFHAETASVRGSRPRKIAAANASPRRRSASAAGDLRPVTKPNKPSALQRASYPQRLPLHLGRSGRLRPRHRTLILRAATTTAKHRRRTSADARRPRGPVQLAPPEPQGWRRQATDLAPSPHPETPGRQPRPIDRHCRCRSTFTALNVKGTVRPLPSVPSPRYRRERDAPGGPSAHPRRNSDICSRIPLASLDGSTATG